MSSITIHRSNASINPELRRCDRCGTSLSPNRSTLFWWRNTWDNHGVAPPYIRGVQWREC